VLKILYPNFFFEETMALGSFDGLYHAESKVMEKLKKEGWIVTINDIFLDVD